MKQLNQIQSNEPGFTITVHCYSSSESYSVWINGPEGYGSWRQGLTKNQVSSFIKEETSLSRRTFLYIASPRFIQKFLGRFYGTILIPKVPAQISSIEIK